MASFEDVRKLFADGKPDEAGKIARENWNELSHIDRAYREQLYSSVKPNDNSLAWVACLYVVRCGMGLGDSAFSYFLAF